MNRKLTRVGAALVAVATAGRRPAAVAGPASAQDDEVTLTIGLIQDMSSPNVDRRLPRRRLRGVEPAVRHAHRQGGRRLRHDPRSRRVVGGVRGRADLDVHAARRAAVVRRRAAHRRGHRLHDQPVARRGVDQPLLDGAEPRGDGARRPHASRSSRRCPIRSCRRWTCTSCPSTSTSRSRRRHRRRTTPSTASLPGQYSLDGVAFGPGLDDGQEPQLVRPRQRHRPHRLPRLHQPRRDGRRDPAGRDRRRPQHPAPARSSSSRPTRTSRSSTASRAASPSWRSTAWPAASATDTRRCRTSPCATRSTTPINREGLFQRVNLGLGAVGTTISPSADPSWIPDLGDENFTYDPDLANEMLDEAGYLDTDGDGVREMPDGSRPLEFRYVERSESADRRGRSASS